MDVDRIVAFYPELAGREKNYFLYNVAFDDLAASAVGSTDSFTVDTRSDFIVLGISFVCADAAGTTEVTFPAVTIQLTDTSSGENWFNEPTALMNVAGKVASGAAGAAGPLELLQPRYLPAGTTLTATVTNLTGTARTLWISFHGARIYGQRRGR